MRKAMIGLALCLILFHPPICVSQEEASGSPPLELTLKEAVLLALVNNIDIKVERLQPLIAETEVTAEESVFDPTVDADASHALSRQQSDVAPFLTGAIDLFGRTNDIGTGVVKKFSTGATADVRFDTEQLDTNSLIVRFDPSWTNNLVASLTQPLLKDFGREFNLGRIMIAKNNKNISDIQFKQQVIDTVSQVEETYWDLVRAIEFLEVVKQAVKQAQELLEINKAKVEVGQLAPVDIIEAEAAVAAREVEIIVAEDDIEDIQDRLRNLLDLSGETPWHVEEILPEDLPTDAQLRFSLKKEVETALENRPDYLQAKTDLENRLIGVKLAKNQVRPRVDLVASAGLNGLGGTFNDSLGEMDGDFYDLFVGLRFEYPLGNRAAKSQLIRRELEKREIELEITDLEKIIGLQVREGIRQVETDYKRIRTTRVSRRLAEEKLEGAQAKFEVGISTTKDVLDFQIDLAFARNAELEALIDYNKSLVRLYRLLGTTLEEKGITATMLESG
jgi:outer membrane protein TolC